LQRGGTPDPGRQEDTLHKRSEAKRLTPQEIGRVNYEPTIRRVRHKNALRGQKQEERWERENEHRIMSSLREDPTRGAKIDTNRGQGGKRKMVKKNVPAVVKTIMDLDMTDRVKGQI